MGRHKASGLGLGRGPVGQWLGALASILVKSIWDCGLPYFECQVTYSSKQIFVDSCLH